MVDAAKGVQGHTATLDLDLAGLANCEIGLDGVVWRLTGPGGTRDLGGDCGARMRITLKGVTYLLAGGNGHASVLSAIRAAHGGETILVAPGVYRETEAFVIDRPVTLLGVSGTGKPILDHENIAATIIAVRTGAGKGFAVTASGVIIGGLALLADARPRAEIPIARPSAIPQVRLFNGGGRLKHIHQNIQAALDAADEGDRIVVQAGRHVGDLFVRRGVTLAGVNVGRPGDSPRREVESTLLGHVVMCASAASLVLDGLTLQGAFEMEHSVVPGRCFALRNCVIDGRDVDCAISVARGTASEIINNMVYGGLEEAICVGSGFDDLTISGNRIQIAVGAVGIALNGGRGRDRIEILANTFMGGDYGILIETDGGLGEQGDAVLLSGNHFGEECSNVVRGAPAVAAVHADGPMPSWLEFSLGLSIDLNTYHAVPPGVGADIVFDGAYAGRGA